MPNILSEIASVIDNSTVIRRIETDSIVLYDDKTIDRLKWPEDPETEHLRKFIEPLIKHGIPEYVVNVDAKMFALQVDELVLPVLVPQKNKHNSYVCSPHNNYITLGKDNIKLFNNRFVIGMMNALLAPLDKLTKYGHLDNVVYVNHRLSAMDLYPREITTSRLSKIVDFLQERFPDRAIIFRSLNAISTPSLIPDLKELDCHLIPSRYVYLTDCTDERVFQARVVKTDFKVWNQSSYEYVSEKLATKENCSDFYRLERLLYIIQHSSLHPEYKQNFVELLFSSGFMKFKSLRREGKCVGVAGYLENAGVMYCPFIGFDKGDPDHSMIFRLLNTSLLLEAKEKRYLYHQSAGASFYKTIRRAKGTLEYNAVYTKHLPKKQKMVWYLLSKFINSFGPNLMKRY